MTYEGCCEMSHLVSGYRYKSSKENKNLAVIYLSIKYLINLSVQNIKKVIEEYNKNTYLTNIYCYIIYSRKYRLLFTVHLQSHMYNLFKL